MALTSKEMNHVENSPYTCMLISASEDRVFPFHLAKDVSLKRGNRKSCNDQNMSLGSQYPLFQRQHLSLEPSLLCRVLIL